MTQQDIFVTRLRRHRERNTIALDEIARATSVKRELFEAFERNDLDRWPRGVYARAWVRAYASLVGLDPMDTVDEFCRLFPQGDRRAGRTLQAVAAIVAHPSEYRDEFSGAADRRRGTPVRGCPAAHACTVGARINMLRPPAWHVPLTRSLQALWLRWTLKPSPVRVKRTPRAISLSVRYK
ncbi:MAG: hypothetical protein A3I61_11570 [Acidobacteria bacterium RIFCSPLOWO2_02_FULL_68_18]|nr:MAG: hypothetical protein A3I61_11570 [Acidobacteria bacterium RIFCSPLOWO2_02_FULL_68_18]OFW50700.1 MAG: hypothetical protein A3G77_17320 [Acidobacteria bacterium RIFCSPLOWO2_12_FULL_68_19]